MRSAPEFWLSEVPPAVRSALDVLTYFRDEQKASDEFIGSILGKVRTGGRGVLVAVGCSPAVKQELIVRDILQAVPGLSGTGSSERISEQVISFPAPPLVGSLFEQRRVLHDRYRAEAGALEIRYKHEPRYPEYAVMQRSTETEALVSMLRTRKTKAVLITSAHNLIGSDVAVSALDRLFRHTADIARRASVPHILIGERGSIMKIAASARFTDENKVVLQRLYDHRADSDVSAFASILKGYQATLRGCTEIVLAERTERIMERTGGDPCRVSEWLIDGLCEAVRKAQKLDWTHLNQTGPRLTQINEANRELSNYLAWEKFEALDSPLFVEEHQSNRVDSTKPGVRRPARDPVPPGRQANIG